MSNIFTLVFLCSILGLIVGLIRPSVFSRFSKTELSRGKVAKWIGSMSLIAFVGAVATAEPVEKSADNQMTEIVEENKTLQIIPSVAVAADTEAELSESDTVSTNATITKVVDGDTVSVELNGTKETIRIIGINTPETVDPRKPVECFGKEASLKATELLSGKTVTLEADPSQGERDKYGRLLRYVFFPDGSDFGRRLISEGYAYEYTYSTPYKYQQDYKNAQVEAQAAKRGLWADDACVEPEGDFDASEAGTVPTTSVSSSTIADSTESPTKETASNVTDNTSSTTTTNPASPSTEKPFPTAPTTTTSCSCPSVDVNCGNFTTHAQAQAVYACCMAQVGYDVHRLDGNDNDGVACESLP